LVVEDTNQPCEITAILEELGITSHLVSFKQAEELERSDCSLMWLTCPSYPFRLEISPKLSAAVTRLLEGGSGVFAEYISNFPGVPFSTDPYKTGVARLFVSSPLETAVAGLPIGTILDEHDSVCLLFRGATQNLRTLLSFGQVRGVERVFGAPAADKIWPGILWGEAGQGKFAVSATSISGYRKREYAPVAHWEQFLRSLVLALLPAPQQASVAAAYVPCRAYTEPRAWVMPGEKYKVVVETRPDSHVELDSPDGPVFRHTRDGRFEADRIATGAASILDAGIVRTSSGTRRFQVEARVADRKTAYRRALERNMQWFERSGVLLRPDGTLGVTEWISGPDTEGNRIPYGKAQMFASDRTDCVFESGIAFILYGKLAASPRHTRIGENLLMRVLDFQRLDRDDSRYGLWYTRGRSGPPWEDDIGWATIGCFMGYQLTGKQMFLERGVLSARASLAAVQGGRLTPVNTEDDNELHPHDRGHLLASWLYAYGVSGDRRYLDAALPPLRHMVERFRKIPKFLISKSAESSRFMLPLALAYAYTSDPFYSEAMAQSAAYLRSRTAACGAIQEDQSNTGEKLSGTDLGLVYDGTETISDQLYTTNFASMNFWIAYKVTGDEAYLRDFIRVTDYLVRIQVESAKREIDGGWMRAFDYGLWEYYGSNADQSWTAYCLETGWTNAIIDIALSLFLLDDMLYQARPAAV